MGELVDGEILKSAQRKLENALAGRLTKRDRIQYEILQLLVLYLVEDHPKVKEMWPVYLWGRWALLIMGGVWIAALAMGKMTITIFP